MATIRMTQDIKSALHTAAKMLFASRIEDAQTFFMDESTLAHLIVDTYIEDAGMTDAWAKMPIGWVDFSASVRVCSINGWHPRQDEFTHTLVAADRIAQPRDCLVSFRGYVIVNHPEFDQLIKDWTTWIAQRDRVLAERDLFASKVSEFLNRHPTLKSALNAWPQLWDLVPDTMRALHNKTVARAIAKKLPDEREAFDTSDMTGALVKTKLVNSLIN